ncbi:MAG: hypothetical protein A2504_00480 [Bdellovibrionales bacterium RIFOXYD12_FULL_39_22]|nr:MAG: hypothetical protein A2385_14765 [Bdellovibrionales bacterium RIFOXYB1_FULL_39_21]OFZ43998.1 MAG: hypothetical protein A2485_12410 [Bdellovibrionales bacterium RIFOXYC12_FULL_39_17]OFZ47785.1 MAG: hypothetical protein A2404_14225 [Bdellovibrionales bacterium RIFOXYC1_FULL_39_130]OFZ76476.1 MAG: hypothetical protein A2560_17625 [Bdellovibrionales bacterium RIFOXYD1_FULL_39_84]OFZ95154.1 MAG: hypothetical protein A2504_00480 [Bdellovibrionales bacterium RIFOXYD12_FULL_39_22]HLE11654.1 he
MKIIEIFEFIESHLGDELNIELVAKKAGFSNHHFQRLFAASAGVSLGTYIRRRRLTKAAERLKESADRIIEIALESGFDSQEAFTRSFKSMFAATPKDYRDNHSYSQMRGMGAITQKFLEHIKYDGVNLTPEFIIKPEKILVGMKKKFARSGEGISELWGIFNSRIESISNKKGAGVNGRFATYGACEEIWIENKIQDEFYYMAAIEVDQINDAITDLATIKIPETKFAVFCHNGSLRDFSESVKYVWNIWLPESGLELGPMSDIEYYSSDFNPDSPKTKIEIWIPIAN